MQEGLKQDDTIHEQPLRGVKKILFLKNGNKEQDLFKFLSNPNESPRNYGMVNLKIHTLCLAIVFGLSEMHEQTLLPSSVPAPALLD